MKIKKWKDWQCKKFILLQALVEYIHALIMEPNKIEMAEMEELTKTFCHGGYPQKKVRMFKMVICVHLILLSLLQCTKPEVHAHESLVGTWQVDSISILYTKPASSTIDSIWKSSIPAGKILFTENEIKLSYVSRNQKTEFSSDYKIESSKEHAGFFKIRKWQLLTANDLYEIEYGDQTHNAHKNAKYITLTLISQKPINTETEILFISKQ